MTMRLWRIWHAPIDLELRKDLEFWVTDIWTETKNILLMILKKLGLGSMITVAGSTVNIGNGLMVILPKPFSPISLAHKLTPKFSDFEFRKLLNIKTKENHSLESRQDCCWGWCFLDFFFFFKKNILKISLPRDFGVS